MNGSRALLGSSPTGVHGYIEAAGRTWVISMLGRANPCPADLTTVATPVQPGYGSPNGVPDADDFFYYLAQFAAGNLVVADLTATSIAGSPGYGQPNGIVNTEDFFYYLTIYSQGCP